jgi:hypothetical protein
MNSEQTGEYIFSKMTSFSLLNFKFTQIFLMGQNDFSKITELSVNANFSFSKDYCYFHTSNTIRLNFNKFHHFFKLFKNRRNQSPPNFFFAPHEFPTGAH